jgi:hypothetical protein
MVRLLNNVRIRCLKQEPAQLLSSDDDGGAYLKRPKVTF